MNQPGPEVSEVVVTGSYIAGTPTNSALPVDVVSSQTLEKQGSPTALQLVKTLTASTSGIGESNRYNGGAGTASINLRGFGSSRTLVLMNGRRLSDSAQGAFDLGGDAVEGCFSRVLHGDIAKAKAPPLKASCLSTRAQKNLLPGCAIVPGRSITSTKIRNVIPTRAAASRAWTRTAILSAAQIKARTTR